MTTRAPAVPKTNSKYHLVHQSHISLSGLVGSDIVTLSDRRLGSPVSRVPESPHDDPFHLVMRMMVMMMNTPSICRLGLRGDYWQSVPLPFGQH